MHFGGLPKISPANPRTFDYVTLSSKRNFAVKIKLRLLWEKENPEFSGGLNTIPSVLPKEAMESK